MGDQGDVAGLQIGSYRIAGDDQTVVEGKNAHRVGAADHHVASLRKSGDFILQRRCAARAHGGSAKHHDSRYASIS